MLCVCVSFGFMLMVDDSLTHWNQIITELKMWQEMMERNEGEFLPYCIGKRASITSLMLFFSICKLIQPFEP